MMAIGRSERKDDKVAEKIVRIGAGSGGLIDSALGILQHIQSETPPDYVIFDHLGEGMMAHMALGQKAAPDTGWSTVFLDMHIGPYLDRIAAKGIKIISNAGGLNPHGLAKLLRAEAEKLGISLRIGVVTGDDLRPMLGELEAEGHRDMFSGDAWPDKIVSANAYLGGFPIAEAISRGADIVLTGRVVDSALVLGPLIHEFGWRREDYDLLAAGTLAGHLLECGAQSSGGTFTDWLDLPDLDNVGFPYAECRADGSFVMTKQAGTGGAVSFGTVAEQMLYEVSDPAAYLVPDVACDFTAVTLEEVGADRVEVTGAIGRAPTGAYKICATYDDGWKATALIPVFGQDADRKARRVGEAVLGRTRMITDASDLPPPKFTHCEVIGAGDLVIGGAAANSRPTEVFARLVYHSDSARAAQILAFESGTPALIGSPGSVPFFGASCSPITPLFSFTLPRDRVRIEVSVDGETIMLEPETAAPTPGPHRPAPQPDTTPATGCDARLPLIALAYGRSGDKGNLFNIGVIARRPEYLPYIRAALSPEAVAEWMGHTFDNPDSRQVSMYDVPGVNALNFVLHDTLHGANGTGVRFDANAKSMAQQLLQIQIPVPDELARRWDGSKLAPAPGMVPA
jgi:hypothetical protein